MIRSFLPESLLRDFDMATVDMDTFLGLIVKARYMQKVWKNIVQTGVWEGEEA